MPSLVGTTVSHYKLLDEISRGGMGVVYRAVDLGLNREVALKVLPPDLVADADRRQRFIQEARAASALEHPHIAVIHEIGEADGVSFIAMELIRGEKLRDLITREPLPAARALDLAIEIAEGLTRAHDKGIVHRDLKPHNVMVTEDGHSKIIDFGLAKLIEPLGTELTQATALRAGTDPGMILGTVSYMSPEQARGAKVDHRSDIFAFGVVLYEMLTGALPFRGHSGLDTLHAILNAPTPSLPSLGSGISPDATGDVQRILEKCLAKAPESRYQGMRDLVVDLRAARRRLESGSFVASAPRARSRRLRPLWIAAAAAALTALVAGGLLLRRPGSPAKSTAREKPSVAVLYFENNTGNAGLDWLRTGLTDLVVTDLSQSPQIEVLSTDRLYQILSELKRQDDRVTSFDVIQQVAQRAGVDTVLVGSYMKAGETLRINVKLQEAASGKILTSERVEALGESNLFAMVDDLTRRIKSKFEMPREMPGTSNAAGKSLFVTTVSTPGASGVDRDLKEVTTSSIEAYRYYAEAINLHERFREEEAVPLLEKAVAVDPGFAMALTKLAVIHGNLGHASEADQYGARALQHVDRLTTRERYYIEGYNYSRRQETLPRAIEAYKKGIELYPDHASARHNLALIYLQLDKVQESIEHYEDLRRRGMSFPATYGNLADAYGVMGQFDKGHEVLQQYLRRSPDNAAAYENLGTFLISWGKLDEGLAALDKGEALQPGHPSFARGRWGVFALRDQWAEAEAVSRKLAASSDSFWRWRGFIDLATLQLYRGRSAEALGSLERAVRAYATPGGSTAVARATMAHVLLESDRAGQALSQAQVALGEGKGRGAEWQSRTMIGLAQARLGRLADAQATLDELAKQAASFPSDREQRRVRHLTGELALSRGDAARAVDELTRAQAALLARWLFIAALPPSPHVPIWWSLANAHLAAGNDAEAAKWFRRIAESTTERLLWPIPYVRSLYFLGKIHEKRGEPDKAREYYRRFVGYWERGDLDRARVAEAIAKSR